ncbi:RHS repeat-associated core domain-containing protein, partial [Xanthomonas sp. SHU 166]|uniref:RHS repeat-associated core domain-containing protein n=1 Tax=Xanthomonas sp. SHU 166 TaxID=1591170 RepID=UPI0012FF13C0
YQYTGRERDASGLYYYRARYYAPSLGRFLSEDPIGLAGGVNPYAYVRGSPVVLTDPLGLVDVNYVPLGEHIDNYGGMQLIRSRYSCRAGAELNGNPAPVKKIADVLYIPVQATDLYVWTANNAIAPYQGRYGKTPEGKRDKANPGK